MTKIIQVENLGKTYKIGHEKQERYIALRDVISEKTKSLVTQTIGLIIKKETHTIIQYEKFWALKDVSFEIHQGDRVGIIGRNGAGKSTVLKILGRIIEPTTGRVKIKGRVASLLEVGTGFHPELTGRENIFLNGAILGMNRGEVKRKFDEIVDFSEIENFLDTPVKRYSSGMYVRLAFGVAAHLEPEILLVDEVLAVGDAEFQKKCLGKMKDVAGEGRTVIFVSHNMNAINSLCSSCIYLKRGEINSIGNTDKIVNEYLSLELLSSPEILWIGEKKPGDDIVVLHRLRLIDIDHNTLNYINLNQRVGIEITYEILQNGFSPFHDVVLYSTFGVCVFMSYSEDNKMNTKIGKYISVCWIPENLLNTETYILRYGMYTHSTGKTHFDLQDIISFEVIENTNDRKTDYLGKWHGLIRPKLFWENTELL